MTGENSVMNMDQELFDEAQCQHCACGSGLDFDLMFAFQPIAHAHARPGFETLPEPWLPDER